jgi:prepilin-type processing-associated H-X9-DG protein/prepilin-type N-terminal cleavage/methylation domain-containing protein
MVRSGRTKTSAAFTLVELLVVLGIIAVLISLLMPALVGVRKKAQAAVCAANMRSIGQALFMYTQRYNYYPCCYLFEQSHVYAIWPVRLRALMGGEQGVFYCPSQDERCEWKRVSTEPGAPGRATEVHARFGYDVGEPLLDSGATYFSYGYNAWGAANDGEPTPNERHKGLGDMLLANPTPADIPRRELHVRRVRKPAEMVAVTDKIPSAGGDFGVKPDPPMAYGRPGVIHSGGSNVLFCDGHVQWYPQKELLVTYNNYVPSEAAVRRMWNNDHRVNGGIGYDPLDGG